MFSTIFLSVVYVILYISKSREIAAAPPGKMASANPDILPMLTIDNTYLNHNITDYVNISTLFHITIHSRYRSP